MLEVKGSFRVNKVRAIQSNIQYAILFLKDRMIFVKIGGQFADGGLAGAIAGGAVGGAVGAIIGSSIDQKIQKSASKRKEEKIKSLNEMSIEDLIQMDKNNFEMLYGEIIGIEVKNATFSLNGARTGVLTILSKKKEKFDIAPNQNFDECYNIINTILPEKMKR
jgi:hypothetical protein